jgi:N-acetylglucosaminyldiphosphoundecaprenol N-acetyl-beta-D-mannosaminyltransferase
MSKQTLYDKVGILGIDIDVLSTSEAIDYICTQAADRHQPAGYVIKPYVEFLARAARKSDLRDLLNNAQMAIADGVAVVWAAHYLYAGARSTGRFWFTLIQIVFAPHKLNWPLPDRAAGTNFTWALLKVAAAHNLRVGLIGKQSLSEIEQVVTAVTSQIPDLQIVCQLSGRDPQVSAGNVSPAWLEATTLAVETTRPDIVLIGMGFPLQERVASHLAGRLTHGLCIGEGGTFDYESFGGNRPKAPEAIQRVGLEWLWRLVKEPKRIKRQLAIPVFIYLVWRSRR